VKALLAVLLALVAGLVLYNYVTRGELTLEPEFLLSDGERQVEALERQLDAAQRSFMTVSHAASISATDLAGEVEAARREVARIEKELREKAAALQGRAKEKADKLQRAIEAFKRELE
jgi:cell division septum initiation protein DivIVA